MKNSLDFDHFAMDEASLMWNENTHNSNDEGVAAPTVSPVSSPENSPDEEEDGEARPTTWTTTTWDQPSFPSTIGSDENVPITGGVPSDGGHSLINFAGLVYHLITLNILFILLLH